MLDGLGQKGQKKKGSPLEVFGLSRSCPLPSRDVGGAFTREVLHVVMLAQKEAVLRHPIFLKLLGMEVRNLSRDIVHPMFSRSCAKSLRRSERQQEVQQRESHLCICHSRQQILSRHSSKT